LDLLVLTLNIASIFYMVFRLSFPAAKTRFFPSTFSTNVKSPDQLKLAEKLRISKTSKVSLKSMEFTGLRN
jgi:hypothetical protein